MYCIYCIYSLISVCGIFIHFSQYYSLEIECISFTSIGHFTLHLLDTGGT